MSASFASGKSKSYTFFSIVVKQRSNIVPAKFKHYAYEIITSNREVKMSLNIFPVNRNTFLFYLEKILNLKFFWLNDFK